MPSYDTISFFRFKEHDFSVLEEMENLHTLIFNTLKPLTITDFSFLEKCKKLKKLDLSQTNFTDCALLTHLPMLTYVRLPEKKRLVNTQVLDMLCAKIDFDEVKIHEVLKRRDFSKVLYRWDCITGTLIYYKDSVYRYLYL